MTWSDTARVGAFLLLCSACGTPAKTPAPRTQQTAAQAPAPESPAPAPANAPQTSPPQAPLPRPQFFGGTVTALDPQHITISRTSPGKSPEHRTFLINPKTRMSKSVKVKSRVTVRYRHLPEGDVALEIQIRPLMRPRVS